MKSRKEVIKNVVEQIINMLNNNVLGENGSESFVGWCEDGDVFEEIHLESGTMEEHIEIMNRLADKVDDLSWAIEELMDECYKNELQGNVG